MTNSGSTPARPRTLAVAGATGTLGRHVVELATARGHSVVPLSRASGHDLMSGSGLASALEGADAVIDVTSTSTLKPAEAVAFFRTATENLLAAERAAGVAHHVAVSIVGIDAATGGYYAGKLAQEAALAGAPADGPGWSLLRAAQFHEFPEQLMTQTSFGPIVYAPTALIRPVAAAEVAEALVDLAEGDPVGRARDLVGPHDERLADLMRRVLRHRAATGTGRRRLVVEAPLPGDQGRVFRSGSLRGGPEARHGRVSFEEWLAGR
ncbi:MAG: NAD(P)H-binding protein [Actinomycetales bacterium]|nr:NAD(P)H-binding protein [Actinomycetales bacterium]